MKKVLLGLLYVISGLAGSVIMLVNGLLIAYMIEEITKEPFDMKKGIALGMMILVEILASMMVCTPVETAVDKIRIRKSETLKKELTKAIADFNALVQECRRELTQQKEYVENLNYEVSAPDLEHYAKTLTEEQLADFGVHTYLAEDYINQERCKTAEIQTECEVIIGKVKECSKDFVMVAQYSGKLDSICRKLKKQNKEFQEKLMDIREKKGKIENMLEKKLTCTLQVEEVSGLPYVTGLMSCHDHRGRLKKGGYKLDEVTMLGKGKLGDLIGETGIYVYGYEDENGCVGLELRSTELFTYGFAEEELPVGSVRRAVLKGGIQYCLTLKNTKKMNVTIKVQ